MAQVPFFFYLRRLLHPLYICQQISVCKCDWLQSALLFLLLCQFVKCAVHFAAVFTSSVLMPFLFSNLLIFCLAVHIPSIWNSFHIYFTAYFYFSPAHGACFASLTTCMTRWQTSLRCVSIEFKAAFTRIQISGCQRSGYLRSVHTCRIETFSAFTRVQTTRCIIHGILAMCRRNTQIFNFFFLLGQVACFQTLFDFFVSFC